MQRSCICLCNGCRWRRGHGCAFCFLDDDKIAWYENNENQGFTEQIITTNADYATSVYATDVDGDGDMDVLSASF